MNSVIFQGTRLSLSGPDCCLSREVVKLINASRSTPESSPESSRSGSTGHSERNNELFKHAAIPQSTCADEHYIERSIGYPIGVALDKEREVCWQFIKKEIARTWANPGVKEVFVLSWPNDPKVDISCHRTPKEGHEECIKLVKVSDLLNINDKRECVSNMRQLLELNSESTTTIPSTDKILFVELDNQSDPNAQFEKLCSKGKHLSIHWFQAFKFGFKWRKSVGRFASPKSFRPTLKDKVFQENKWLVEMDKITWQDIILVSGEAGIGKSTFFIKTAQTIKSTYKERLVLLIQLKRLDWYLERYNERTLDKSSFIHQLCLYFELTRKVERRVLQRLMTEETKEGCYNVEILLDGISEMSPKGRKLILDFFRNDKIQIGNPKSNDKNQSRKPNRNYRVWLSTRPHYQHMAEELLQTVAQSLYKFSLLDISLFLESRGRVSKEWVEEVCSSALKTRSNLDLSTILTTPQMLIAFEKFALAHKLKNKKNSPSYCPLKLMEALLKVVELHYNSTLRNGTKVKFSKEMFADINERHAALAIPYFMKKPLDKILSRFEGVGEREIMEYGIVSRDYATSLPIFVNPAFVGYFVVKHSANTMTCSDNRFRDFFLQKLLFLDEWENARVMYEQQLWLGIKNGICQSWFKAIREFMIATYDLDKDIPDDQPQPTANLLQLMLIDRRILVVKMILKSFAPDHLNELCRLIKRKVWAEINDVEKQRSIKGESRGESSSYHNEEEQCYLELSSLSLAIMFGDRKIINDMYFVLDHHSFERNGDKHMLKFSTSPKLTKRDTYRFNPIHLAVVASNVNALTYLLQRRPKIDPKALDLKDHTPLHLIFYNEWILKFQIAPPSTKGTQAPVVREVHIKKCFDDLTDPNVKNKLVEMVKDTDQELGASLSEVFCDNERLLSRRRLNVCYKRPINSYLKIVDKLCKKTKKKTSLNKKAKVEGSIDSKDSPLHLACAEGHLPLVIKIVENGADLNIQNANGHIPLVRAICEGHIPIVDYLLSREGIDTTTLCRSEINNFPIWIHICTLKNPEMVRYAYTKFKWNPNLKIKDGRTALHVACEEGCLETVKVLVELRADVNIRDDKGVSPLYAACHQTPEKCCLEIIQFLIESGADVNANEREQGYGPLHIAVVLGNLELVKKLIECQNLNVNLPAHAKITPLHLAAEKGCDLEIMKCLVEAGAGLELEDAVGKTPITYFERRENKDPDMAVYLMENGASLHH